MKNECKKILYIYSLLAALLSFVCFTSAGVITAEGRTRYIESKEPIQMIYYKTDKIRM